MSLVTGPTSRLYAIVDVDSCQAHQLAVVDFARAVCEAKPHCIQLRAKHGGTNETLVLLRDIVQIAHAQGILVYANDRPELALLADADGVHVGQNDVPVPQVRQVAPGLRIGVSTNGEHQMREALAHAPDYVACGPIFATPSKSDAEEPVGISGLATSARLAKAAQIPLVAIGGIGAANLAAVMQYADQVAMIGALFPTSNRLDDVAAHIRRLMGEGS